MLGAEGNWEYKSLKIETALDDQMNKLVKEGWELVTIWNGTAIFKRNTVYWDFTKSTIAHPAAS